LCAVKSDLVTRAGQDIFTGNCFRRHIYFDGNKIYTCAAPNVSVILNYKPVYDNINIMQILCI